MNPFVQRQMIIWTFVLVVVLGIAIALMLLQPPEKISARRLTTKAGRQPASIEVEAAVRLGVDQDKISSAEDIALPCDVGTPIPSFKSNIRQVRLSGAFCTPESKGQPTQMDIRNKTNGFSATVFFLGGSQFTTDYININDGENQVVIRYIFKDGTDQIRNVTLLRPVVNEK